MNKYKSPDEVLPLEWNLYDKVCPALAPLFYEKLGMPPNAITLLNNLIFIPLALHSFYNRRYGLFILFVAIRQMFDGLDGYVARKYKHYSDFGDKLDHGFDVLFNTLITLVSFMLLKDKRLFVIIIIVLGIAGFYVDKRGKCVQDRSEGCDEFLRNTRIFSFFESIIMYMLGLSAILIYDNNKK